MTGADSPVMADSSTEATPSRISPSEGMNSPACTITTSPLRSEAAGTVSVRPLVTRLAVVSVRVLRRVSAWALPRPSAIASARLAKSTVAHSHTVICSSKPMPAAPVARSRTSRTVVSAAPTSTTNMTGFLSHHARVQLPERVDRGRPAPAPGSQMLNF